MTQPALPEAVMSDFADATIDSGGLAYRVFRRGDTYWAEMPDPELMLDVARGRPGIELKDIPRVERQVTMTTGSHHYQTYWVASTRFDTVMQTLPLVYLPKESRWIPREAAFLSPPEQPLRMITLWNDHCIGCHSTGGSPGLKGPRELDTSVGELGIACEACHGPGKRHVQKQLALSLADLDRGRRRDDASIEADRTIVNPARLDHKGSSQVCGQCHGVFIRDEPAGMEYARRGDSYRPGDDLHADRIYIRFPKAGDPPEAWRQLRENRGFYRERWWDDGTLLAGGREYTALRESACFERGEMSCLSCHSMHDAPPAGQVSAGMDSSAACTQCHTEPRFNDQLATHTHHAADSTGSACMNCHMPHTSYALFRAIRNHSISSPTVAQSTQHGVPNACNLCHLDQTLGWTQENLVDWYDHTPVALEPDQRDTAASIQWLLEGDAAQRVVTAWHYGWAPAQQASGVDWAVPVLAPLLADPYKVVRYVTDKSLQSLPTGGAEGYDFLAQGEAIKQGVRQSVRQWRGAESWSPVRERQAAVLHTPSGEADWGAIKRRLSRRNNRPVSIKE